MKINKNKIFKILGIVLVVSLINFAYQAYQKSVKERKHQEWVAGLVSTASVNVQILKDTIELDYLGEKRTLSVYLPPNYETDSLSYPVIYFMDGNSLFDEKLLEGNEWQVDEVLDSISKIGGPMAIVIGIGNSDKNRLTEYKPFKSPHLPKEKVVTGVEHAEWIATDVKKWVDQNYRTKPEPESTTIGGCSLSGLMSYYMLTSFSETYGSAIVFSPSFWVNDKVYDLHKQVADLSSKRIFINAGSIEQPTVESVQKMYDILLKAGMPAANIKMDVELDEGHWHMTWRKGFVKAYPWILGDSHSN